jgi:exosortase J
MPRPDLSLNFQNPQVLMVSALVLTLLGLLFGFSQRLFDLYVLWTHDSLRSIGMIMPVAAGYFLYKKRNQLSFEHGSWMGLVLMLLPLLLNFLMGSHVTLNGTFFSKNLSLNLITTGALLAMYFSGALIYFSGFSAWRVARFSLFLLLWVNPMPGMFSAWDFQLQTIAALTARGFAHLISLPVEPGLLKMMFAPELGMFIAPECNGLRGVTAMLCLSLILGHHFNLSFKKHVFFVTFSVMIAYVMNLLRLCLVVIYYWFAVRNDALAAWGTEIDYAIGGALFFACVLFLMNFPSWIGQDET